MNNDDLTTEETKLIDKFEASGKWDLLYNDLAYLLPCVVIIIICAVRDSIVGIIASFIAFSILHLWSSWLQCKTMPLIKSAIRKMRRKCQQSAASDHIPIGGRSG